MRPSAARAGASALGCVLLLSACLGVARGAGLAADVGGSLKDNVAQAFHAFELELENANANLLTELAASREFLDLNATASQLNEVFFSKDLDVPIEAGDAADASPDLKRLLLSGHRPRNVIEKLYKFVPSSIQSPTYRPIKQLKFFKRYTFSAGCSLTLKIFGDTPTGDKLFNLGCGKPRLSQAFCYRFPINVPIGALNFDFEFPLCLPDLSGLEGVLKILNGDFTALLDLLNL